LFLLSLKFQFQFQFQIQLHFPLLQQQQNNHRQHQTASLRSLLLVAPRPARQRPYSIPSPHLLRILIESRAPNLFIILMLRI
jgi:hypothetical protein